MRQPIAPDKNMLNVGYFKRGFVIGLLMLIGRILPAALATLTLYLCMQVYGVPLRDPHMMLLIIVALLAFILFPQRATDEFEADESLGRMTMSIALSWASLFAILLFLGYATKSSAIFSRLTLMTWFLVTPFVIIVGQLIVSKVVSRLLVSTKSKRHAIIAGVNPIALSLADKIQITPRFGIVIDGFFEDRSRERLGVESKINIIGRLRNLADYVRHQKTDIIFVAIPIKNVQRVTELLDELHDTTASIYFIPDVFVFDLIQCRSVDIKGIPAVALCETPFYGLRGVSKRIFDYVVALLALILVSPVMLITAILIKLTSKGSVIFKQRRYGLDGREIVVYKFRTMTVAEDSDVIPQATKNDARLTPVGSILRRYSIDELPQLINVLQGRMSIVGPRPHAVVHNEEYRKVVKGYMVRHKVTPGITGLAQVNGFRGETETIDKMEKRIALDLDYLRNWSIALDVNILWKTLLLVFNDKKAY
jgi:putative colanic acid biosynthesis UDP-glucose lipid carrier transferase